MSILADRAKIREHPLWKFYLQCESLDGDTYAEDIEIAQYYVSLILERPMDWYARQIAIAQLYEAFPDPWLGSVTPRKSVLEVFIWIEENKRQKQ